MNSIQQRDSLLIETNFICVKWSFVRETTFNISIVKVFEKQHAKEKNNDCRLLDFKRKKSFVKQQKSLWSVAFFLHRLHYTPTAPHKITSAALENSTEHKQKERLNNASGSMKSKSGDSKLRLRHKRRTPHTKVIFTPSSKHLSMSFRANTSHFRLIFKCVVQKWKNIVAWIEAWYIIHNEISCEK